MIFLVTKILFTLCFWCLVDSPHVESRQSALSLFKGAVLLLSSVGLFVQRNTKYCMQREKNDLKPDFITSAVSFTVRNDIMLSTGSVAPH